MYIAEIVDFDRYPLERPAFQASCKAAFDADGLLVLEGFVRPEAIAAIRAEGEAARDQVYGKRETHNIYLAPPDPDLPPDHPRNREVVSSKGCLTDDQIAPGSALRRLYDDPGFRAFLCAVLGEEKLHEYADPLSSINLHFHERGQELGWHFDNSSFSITMMVQAPEAGGLFEYVPAMRDADRGEMGYEAVAAVLDGRRQGEQLNAGAGTLVFFRGRNALHRVTPNAGTRTRMLAVLAYNAEPGVALSESARLTFYGRTG